MKQITLGCAFLLASAMAFSQITYIGIINHNTGTGVNNLFNNYVSVSQQCYIDWEVYANGMNGSEACGSGSVSRIVLRRTGDTDPSSVVASTPLIVPGICAGKNGNNDHYYAELSSFIDKPGRYSVEIQADLPGQADPFGNATTVTTNNYSCPSAYYLTGTGGPTGNYYTPGGSCAGGPGLSDPVGGPGADRLQEIFPALKFFTVGEAATYREMVVLNGNFFDLQQGKFQPGNPALPSNINGYATIPAGGICPLSNAPILGLGGEINNFKRTDCSHADVTGANLYYRVYKTGTPPPAFDSFALAFKDDCSFSPNGPEGNIFPMGGSCQNANGILDQRWQTLNGVANILPANFSLADTGSWTMEIYTETYLVNCSGTAAIQQSAISSSGFTVNNPLTPGSPCSTVIPVVLSSFRVTPAGSLNVLNWTVEEASQVTGFEIEQSYNGYSFTGIGSVAFRADRSGFTYSDNAHPGTTVYYRLVVTERSGKKYYSAIVSVTGKTAPANIIVQTNGERLNLVLNQLQPGNYHLAIFNTAGAGIADQAVKISGEGYSNMGIEATAPMARGIYHAVLKNADGNIVARKSFYWQ